MTNIEATGWELVKVGEKPEERKWTIDTNALSSDELVVEIAGCGVCHTDLSFHYDGVRTKHDLPLILGHEISGVVIATGGSAQQWMGKRVIIPAVLPCGECDDCNNDRSNVCRTQVMPGNDIDGGFATHIVVPSRWMVEVPTSFEGDLASLSVIADAVSTPWQAIERSQLSFGDVAIIVGCGGVGGYCAQLAKSIGANVICLDIDEKRLNGLKELGIENTIVTAELDNREIKGQVKEIVKNNSWKRSGWRIFECSGHPNGQTLAFELVGPSGVLSVVGFTMGKVTIRLSNLMAHDAKAIGNWGCKPELYHSLLEHVLEGGVDLESTTEQRPLSTIGEVFTQVHDGCCAKRIILVPDY
ncbi:MAG: 6-hydroxycyclohex-1-ene-1-carbonyl-CoA dehydrogenase [Euryarchaeota archaeon]|nr:6-hydroxycyclohex-1-ene-1-carbonyl-CoA dehydrogenase [Euryarchaeota archaeon]MBT4407050.1 6-hydroxycyclohex-1-ene-1-carbonyl-CoA dehydrogenase [Euryarchaeota archaeon]MBT6645643.1 6-hydroxycyclohex-1-ene-1-carbonyl-CoA dehydrogenase [Euryarchaeota archaeon]